MAREGADIIAIDIAGKLPPYVPYNPATPDDLDESISPWSTPGTSTDYARPSTTVSAHQGDWTSSSPTPASPLPQAWNAITPEDFRDVMDINVTGTWNTVMAAAQKIIDGGRGGSIILISSAAGIRLQPFMVHYNCQ